MVTRDEALRRARALVAELERGEPVLVVTALDACERAVDAWVDAWERHEQWGCDSDDQCSECRDAAWERANPEQAYGVSP